MFFCFYLQFLMFRVDQFIGKCVEVLVLELFILIDLGIEVGFVDVNGSEIIVFFIWICFILYV